VVALIDLEPQMLFGVANFDRQTIINNNVALLKATKVFEVPVVLSTVEAKSFSGNMWSRIQALYPDQTPIERSSMNSWDDKNFVAAIERSGKSAGGSCPDGLAPTVFAADYLAVSRRADIIQRITAALIFFQFRIVTENTRFVERQPPRR
jgi:hypothetical protein